MKPFLDENFLLQTRTAEKLYHDYAKQVPIIDYHNHLPPNEIAEDKLFKNLTQIWLYGDHYKWRGMRIFGIDEKYITGNASDYEKFEQWAKTVPYTLRNPLYHWTHMELQRYFGIHKLLEPKTARDIYDSATEMLSQPDFSVRELLRKMNVEILCTTDDPTDDLHFHKQTAESGFEIKVFPAWRPDKSMAVDNPVTYNQYLDKLSEVSGVEIKSYATLLDALQKRHDFFAEMGSRVSDHGIEEFYAEDYTQQEVDQIFLNVRKGESPNRQESLKIKSALMVEFGKMDHAKGWVQQFHYGAIRNNNGRMFRTLGPDTGWDSIGDFRVAQSLAKFLDRLDSTDQLAKTIIYNINPADNDMVATMTGNFNDGSVAGKVQFGAGWWFNDQKDGMEKHFNSLSNLGLASQFVGMLTDSRSFLSFPRHEYFRRIICNMFGNDIENGEVPNDMEFVGQMVQDICYYNAKKYFGF
jgi:glucuronate isomerase